MDGWLSSPSGGIHVRVTERGLPVGLRLDQRELSRRPDELARDVLLMCQLAAKRAQVARRRALLARGTDPNAIRVLQLGTEEELARIRSELSGDEADTAPGTWMRPV
jgi:hypothetical protein